ncbi:MAG: zinc metallopeptidase [Bacteroidota bacterium]
MGFFILIAVIGLAGMFVQNRLKSRFRKYSALHLKSNLSGKEVAEMMLKDNGIYDVKVISVPGQLTDHYNPISKTVNLSNVVYGERNAAAAAVAAHEVGHAVQHATEYRWLTMRSRLVPVVNIASKSMTWILLGGILLINVFPQLLLIGIILFACTTLFAFVTLPVEYDASNRAVDWMESRGIVTGTELDASKDALRWAARTYLVAALSSLATLLYYLSRYLNRR